MITSIRLQNFKGHRDTTVPLARFTVLVGPNGAGKTSVLQALDALMALSETEASAVFRDELSPDDIVNRSGGGPIVMTAEGAEDGTPWTLSAEIPVRQPSSGRRGKHSTKIAWTWTYGEASGRNEDPTLSLLSLGPSLSLAEAMGASEHYRFDAHAIAAPSDTEAGSPVINNDGSNAADVLAKLKLEHEEVFTEIETKLRQIVRQVQRLRVRRVSMSKEGRVRHQVLLDFHGAPGVPAHAASEGTLVTLALLTAVFSPSRPNLILLDDIGQSLHPQAQVELVRELKRLLEQFPDVQIVATTHSPYILDELDPGDVQVFALREDGSIASKRLSEHPQAKEMQGALSAGQLWSLDPERRWVAGEG